MTTEQVPFDDRKKWFLEELTTLSRRLGIRISSDEDYEPYVVEHDPNAIGSYTLRGQCVGLRWRTPAEVTNAAFAGPVQTPEEKAMEDDFDKFTGGSLDKFQTDAIGKDRK